MTLHVPHDPTMTVAPTHPKHESTIRAAIRDLQDLCAGLYDIPSGVDKLFAVAQGLKNLGETIDRGPLTKSTRLAGRSPRSARPTRLPRS